ncbi:hypothetical protein CQ010_01430 [Arthrobacter sp. MYb211]|uniref:hypothetical protein n=1 Tax=unclassified Arthrobacter TaxID=235627 RepID=UPI000CFC1E92|nr:MULTISPECIES: hypothetical protein [unclassified Arthrobacter]PRA13336.1 hypothetical protein CQ015_03685 [Arthrobacter sp. MYb221]PRC10533.1 hypothetical protein CQ010_01430 [Arthrobacter sp. MYb211]
MSKCISHHGEYSEHTYTPGVVGCSYCGVRTEEKYLAAGGQVVTVPQELNGAEKIRVEALRLAVTFHGKSTLVHTPPVLETAVKYEEFIKGDAS